MSEHALFYNSVNGDRIYDADDFAVWLRKFFTSGVFIGDLQVLAGDGMHLSVGAGYCNIDGKVKPWETQTDLAVERANSVYDRIDNVVVERRDDDRDFFLKVITGTASASPTAQNPVRENGVYQLVLAQVCVPAGSTKVVQANITDTRPDPSLCGFVAGAVTQIDFMQIQAQFDSYMQVYRQAVADDYAAYGEQIGSFEARAELQFNAWFGRIKELFKEDPAGGLQTQIDALQTDKAAAAHTHTKDEVGLGNVDNTADSEKSVHYAETAGSAVDQTARTTANAAMPQAGGTFTGNVVAYATNRTGANLRNCVVVSSGSSPTANLVSTNALIFSRA